MSVLPLTPSVGWGGMQVEGYVPPKDAPELQVDKRSATPDYFRTMEIPLITGRFFTSADTDKSQSVVLIDQKMADRFWPKGDAVGKRIRQGDKEPWLTIVGVVGVVKQYGLDIDTKMVTYFPYATWMNGEMFVTARTTGDPAALANSIIAEVHTLDSDIPVFDIATMQERVHDSVARQRFAMAMLGAFAGFAVILAAIGVYGVMSFLVTQGTSDIAIRMALGAQRGRILSLVMQQGMGLALIGIAAGVVGALSLTHLMSGLLFERKCNRSGYVCRDGDSVDDGGAGSVLFSGAPCDARGSDGGAAVRVRYLSPPSLEVQTACALLLADRQIGRIMKELGLRVMSGWATSRSESARDVDDIGRCAYFRLSQSSGRCK